MEIKINPFYITLEVAILLKKEGFDIKYAIEKYVYALNNPKTT